MIDVDWMPVIVAGLGLLGAAILHWWQKGLDRKEQVRERHFKAYIDIVSAIAAMANSINRGDEGKEDILSEYATAKIKFALLASDRVLNSFLQFDTRITSGEAVPPEDYDRLLGLFMNEARTEYLGKTDIAADELILLTPFGKSVRGTK